jgi:beta-1,4-mannosyl-glycoprotein beta-1,4-N-acetylglucosaminyltransferase
MSKIFDCITFFDENFLVNSRFEILKDVVDYFVICESIYDHKGDKKKINFNLKNQNFKKKIRHIILDEKFPNPSDRWNSEKFQREKLLDGIKDASDDDFILFSDSDEIPNPKRLENLFLEKDYGIFMQKVFVYKLNIYNQYESPWEGTRVCKKKNLKSFTELRKKILIKNLKKPFWKIGTEKSIQKIEDGGWHFNNLYPIDIISKKLQASPHSEFSSKKYSDVDIIRKKISKLEDLYNRGHTYKKIEIDNMFPDYFLNNANLIKGYILEQ